MKVIGHMPSEYCLELDACFQIRGRIFERQSLYWVATCCNICSSSINVFVRSVPKRWFHNRYNINIIICLSVWLAGWLSVCQTVCLSVCLPACLSVCLFVHLYVYHRTPLATHKPTVDQGLRPGNLTYYSYGKSPSYKFIEQNEPKWGMNNW
jgi:hypothetical protein